MNSKFALIFTLIAASPAHAFWSDELTAHTHDAIVTPDQIDYSVSTSAPFVYQGGTSDCGPDHFSRGTWTPGRTKGGWFETRFTKSTDTEYFQGLAGDPTRACPKTFNETSFNHLHGVMNARTAVYNGTVYAAFDSVSGYYGANKIKIMKDPSKATSFGPGNAARRFTVTELVRNVRQYIDLNPGSGSFIGFLFDHDLNSATDYDSQRDGCEKTTTSWYTGGYKIDRNWYRHFGYDHERTFCGAPAVIQTFDPDLKFRADVAGVSAKAYVAWTERYVEHDVRNPTNGQRERGFDPDFPLGIGEPVERPLRVHVQQYEARDLESRTDAAFVDRVPSTPVVGAADTDGLNVDANKSAMSPRLTTVTRSSPAIRPVLLWAEATFQPITDDLGKQVWGTPAQNMSASLYAKIYNGTSWSLLGGSALGTVCNIQSVSSGRATGRKLSFTGTHDIATVKDSMGTEQPILIATMFGSTGCEVRVKQYDGSAWVDAGSSLMVTAGATPSWPRITVHNNVVYATWVEADGNGDQRVIVRRRDASGGRWDTLGQGDWAAPLERKRVRGPSIAVVNVTAKQADTDPRAMVYVSAAVEEPDGISDGNMQPGAWGVTVHRCQTTFDIMGNASCATAPERYTTPETTFDPLTDLPVYDRTKTLGFAWGERVAGTGPVASQFQGISSQLLGFRADGRGTNYVASAAKPGATNLVVQVVQNTQLMFASWVGPSQDHREFDSGLYVKKDEQIPLMSLNSTIERLGQLIWETGIRKGNLAFRCYWKEGACDHVEAVVVASKGQLDKIVSGSDFSAALSTDGELFTWGSNKYGQLAIGKDAEVSSPTRVESGRILDIALGDGFLVAVTDSGNVLTAGRNDEGQLGNGSYDSGAQLTNVLDAETREPLRNVASVYAGIAHACALLYDGQARCWGSNAHGQLGIGDGAASSAAALPLKVELRLAAMALGGFHTLAVTHDHKLFAVGFNAFGQLGLGDQADRYAPALVRFEKATSIEQLTASRLSSAMLMNGRVYTVGDNGEGTLGIGKAGGSASTWQQPSIAAKTVTRLFSAPFVDRFVALGSEDRKHATSHLYCWGDQSTRGCGATLSGTEIDFSQPTSVVVPNLALHKQAEQSSDAETACGIQQATRAVDGDAHADDRNCSYAQTREDDKAFWQVDLENRYPLHGLEIYAFSSEKGQGQLQSIELLLSDDGISWESYPVQGTSDSVLRVDMPVSGKPVAARFIRLLRTTRGSLGLAEVRVF